MTVKGLSNGVRRYPSQEWCSCGFLTNSSLWVGFSIAAFNSLSLPGFTLLLIKPPTWLWLTTAAGWKWSASGPRYPPHGVITLCEILGWEVSSQCPSLSLFSHLYPGGSCVIPASFPSPLPHPSWSSGENHLLSWLSGDFFFFKYQFPFVPKQPPIRACVCWVWRKAGTVLRAPWGKVAPTCFSFWFDSLPFGRTVRGCSCYCQL